MARYPHVDDYRQNATKAAKGIQRCDDFLKKLPNDIRLLTTKLQLTYVANPSNAESILNQIAAVQPPTQDIEEISTIEFAVCEQLQNAYPPALSAGPQVSKLWDSAVKSATSVTHKLDLISVRYQRAVVDNRLADAQQALIQLKAVAPKNRAIYMAHAIFTQLLSTSVGDMSSRLALSLAKKAVIEKFDSDRELDCRVPGQIFALQESEKDLESIKDRPFKESKQVYEALRKLEQKATNGSTKEEETVDPGKLSSDQWLTAESASLQNVFKDEIAECVDVKLIETFATNAIRLLQVATTKLKLQRPRLPADSAFLAISALVRAFGLTGSAAYLLQAACVAESLLTHYQHIHEAKLVLVYLYIRLGLGSLAMKHFDSLSIRQIQYDTVGHTLFTGIAIRHPHALKKPRGGDFNPINVAKYAMDFYQSCEMHLADSEADVLTHGQTGMILDVQMLRDKLRGSVMKRTFELEQRRIARLTGQPIKDIQPIRPMPLAYWTTLTDNRDFQAAFDYGYNVERELHVGDALEPRVSILYRLAADTAWCLIQGSPLNAALKDPNELLEALTEADSSQLPPEGESDSDSITDAAAIEHLTGKIAQNLLRLVVQGTPSSDSKDSPTTASEDELRAIADSLETLHLDTLLAAPAAIADALPTYFSYAEILRLVHAAATFMSTKKAGDDDDDAASKKAAQELVAKSRAMFEELQAAAKKHLTVGPASVTSSMAKAEATWALLQEFDVEAFAESVSASAQQGWEGFSKVKVA